MKSISSYEKHQQLYDFWQLRHTNLGKFTSTAVIKEDMQEHSHTERWQSHLNLEEYIPATMGRVLIGSESMQGREACTGTCARQLLRGLGLRMRT